MPIVQNGAFLNYISVTTSIFSRILGIIHTWKKIPLVSKGSINKIFEFPSRVLEIISKLILFVKKATYMSVCN